MDRVKVDSSMDGLPMNTVLDDRPANRPLHDKAVNDGPTTANGLLSRQAHTLADREIIAHYATEEAAKSARIALVDAGVAESAIGITAHPAESAAVQTQIRPADETLLGRIREAILPDEASAAARHAARNDDAILTVTPTREQVEIVVRILDHTNPTRFDADLERWRNKG